MPLLELLCTDWCDALRIHSALCANEQSAMVLSINLGKF